MNSDELEFESMGLLRMAEVPPAYKWLTDNDKYLLVHLFLVGGAEGLKKREVEKLEKKLEGSAGRLFANGLADWQTDATGKPNAFALSWKGEEVAKLLVAVARTQTAPKGRKNV